MVFDNKLLRKLFEPRRQQVLGGYRKIHNEEPQHLSFAKYYYVDQMEVNFIGRTCSTHGRDQKSIQYFVWKTCGEGSLLEVKFIWHVLFGNIKPSRYL
jgi:hypothetical protein